jgi:acyl carrier protein
MNDNFFNMGIHSLLIMQVIGRIRDKFDITLPVRSFFLTPTPAGISHALTEQLKSNNEVDIGDLPNALNNLSGEDLAAIADDFAALISREPLSTMPWQDLNARFNLQENVAESRLHGVPELIESIINVTAIRDEPQKITAFCIATGGRPATWQRCTDSYLSNFNEYGNQVETLIVDDSQDTRINQEYRQLLPPYFPFGRATDVVFGKTVWQTMPDSLVAHAPWTLRHAPEEQRQFSTGELSRSASGFDIRKVLLACMQSFQWSTTDSDPARRMSQLGAYFRDLGELTPDAFNDFTSDAAVKYNRRFIAMIEKQLDATDSKPKYWAKELDQYLRLLRKSQLQKDYWVPLDLAIETSV